MAVLTYSQISDLALDRIQANVTTDAPFTSAQIARHINDAYADVFEIAGGQLTRAAHATVWVTDATLPASGFMTSTLTSIGEVIEVFASTTSGSTGDIMTNSDVTLDPVELEEILFMRQNQTAFGLYARPKIYSVTRNFTTTVADVNKIRIDVWPATTSPVQYIPAHYKPQFTDIDSATVTTPSVNDLESRDIALLTAARLAPLAGRAEFVPGILADVSQRTQAALARKLEAMLHPRQET